MHRSAQFSQEQRERLQALAKAHKRRRVYVYGRRKQRLGRETRTF